MMSFDSKIINNQTQSEAGQPETQTPRGPLVLLRSCHRG